MHKLEDSINMDINRDLGNVREGSENCFLNKVQLLKRSHGIDGAKTNFGEAKPGNFTFQDLVNARRNVNTDKSILDHL